MAHSTIIGTILNQRYRVLHVLGEGGMGTVYVAEHIALGRKFAIKILRPELCRNAIAVERFLRESQAASCIESEHVVDIVDTGYTPTGLAYYVMEFLQGEDLLSLIHREGRISWQRVRDITVQICRALEAAHAKGIIHRDLKPENCFRIKRSSTPDYIKILDFGIAKILATKEKDVTELTKTGEIFGTPSYMAPEHLNGERIDHRIDIYSVGIIMYQLLSGSSPFRGETPLQILTQILSQGPIPLRSLVPEANIPESVEKLVKIAMHRDRGQRFPSMTHLRQAIESIDNDGKVHIVPREGDTVLLDRTKLASPVKPSQNQTQSYLSNPLNERTQIAPTHPTLKEKNKQNQIVTKKKQNYHSFPSEEPTTRIWQKKAPLNDHSSSRMQLVLILSAGIGTVMIIILLSFWFAS